jgi:F-type H+-transporting ATPase subunit delta
MTGTDVGLHVADVYSKAIYELAEQFDIVEEVKSELELLAEIIAQEKDFLRIMSSPQFSADYKKMLLHSVFEGKIDDLTLNFMLTVNEHNRMIFLPQIIARFAELWDAHHGISIVELTLNESFSENELQNTTVAISNAMGQKVQLKLNVKPAIMGGAVIRYGTSVIDNSIKARLHRAVRTIIDMCKQTRIEDEIQYQ